MIKVIPEWLQEAIDFLNKEFPEDKIEVFDYMNDDLKAHNMRMNYNWAEKILRCCLENRVRLRDDMNGFIRTEKSENGKRDVVKWYEPPR